MADVGDDTAAVESANDGSQNQGLASSSEANASRSSNPNEQQRVNDPSISGTAPTLTSHQDNMNGEGGASSSPPDPDADNNSVNDSDMSNAQTAQESPAGGPPPKINSRAHR